MDIFLQDIPFNASQLDLIEFFSRHLHSPEFTQRWPGAPVNFNIKLHPDRKNKGYKNGGTAVLTIPYFDMAHDFLQVYGRSLLMGNRYLRASPSTKPMYIALEPLKNTPFQDPVVLRTRERLEEDLRHLVPVKELQFGWVDRDGVFSVEWTRAYDAASSTLTAKIGFKAEKREIFIEEQSTVLSPVPVPRIIIMKISSVERLKKDSNDTYLLFTLYNAPTFEQKPVTALNLPHGTTGLRRTRHSSLDDPSLERVVQYTSLAIRVIFRADNDTRRVQNMAARAKLPSPTIVRTVASKRRNHFSSEYLDHIEQWLITLDWPVAFQCASLLSHLRVSAKEMVICCRRFVDDSLQKHGAQITANVIQRFSFLLDSGAQPTAQSRRGDSSGVTNSPEQNYLDDVLHTAYADYIEARPVATLPPSEVLVSVYHVTLTPTRLILSGPTLEQSNRVLRHYRNHQDCFLRVNFTDEEKLQYRWDRDVDGTPFIQQRIGGTLKKPLLIAGRAFEFLAYSMSALKEHSVWFVTPFVHEKYGVMTANNIRTRLGNFDVVSNCPARYAARISQAFSATDPSITLEAEEIIRIPDIEAKDTNGEIITFTDGVGTMSRDTAFNIARALAKHREHKRRGRYKALREHCVFQVRIGGSKGMLSVDYKASDSAICLRPSMEKFDAPDSLDIEVAGTFERPGPMYLNRPLIMVLETLGVSIDAFMHLQAQVVADIKIAPTSLTGSAKLLQTYGLGNAFRLPSVLLGLAKAGMATPPKDGFFKRGMHFATNDALRGLKYKARIPVPDSYTLVGVADIHNVLEEGQIYVRLRDRNKWDKDICLRGPVLVTRSPVAHPGDVQMVNAIGLPPPGFEATLGKLFNVVVFASKGQRSLPQSLGGGDLDGDLYNIITHRSLYPSRTVIPAAYPKTKLKILPKGQTCKMEDIADFVVDYIQSDHIGLISHQSLMIADQCGELMMGHPDCLRLAQMATEAVDFAKSGYPADLTGMPQLHYRQRPDWSAGEMVQNNYGNYYNSTHALGVLFRMIMLPSSWSYQDSYEPEEWNNTENDLVEALENFSLEHINGPALISDEISQLLKPLVEMWTPVTLNADTADAILPQFRAFAIELQYIAANCSLVSRRSLSEEECWAGTIAAKSSQPRARQELQARVREQCDRLVASVRALLAFNEQEELEDWLHRTWVAWLVSKSLGNTFGARSYGYIALGSMFEALKDLEEREAFH